MTVILTTMEVLVNVNYSNVMLLEKIPGEMENVQLMAIFIVITHTNVPNVQILGIVKKSNMLPWKLCLIWIPMVITVSILVTTSMMNT